MTSFSIFVRQSLLSPLIQASSRKYYSGSDILMVDSKEDKAEVTYYSRSGITYWFFDGTPCIVLLSRFLKSATENITFFCQGSIIHLTGKRDLGFLQQLLFVNFF